MGINGLRSQILANAAELFLHKNTGPLDLPPKLLLLIIRRSDKGYRAVILSSRILRLEGPEGHSAQQALELLLELTAELLEEVCETWEYVFAPGEEVKVFEDGARIVVREG
ncbi:hypothetical protein LTR78_007632 [Recurvomyces mirabilis]|uniref:Uncharacterized protein n=1 Tax=Recurvomyces mirabilis TaxID=574656 RepID=A0AAE0TVD7_9PEZI|nr:hypothetical protein LTR78_007632 [Recurvomyces mirabilis]KAK5159857.1 hypothetical protein LTS14_001962 [Recurvomyces mirabilis]